MVRVWKWFLTDANQDGTQKKKRSEMMQKKKKEKR